MKMKRSLTLLSLVVALGGGFSATAQEFSLRELQERMRQRIPQINELKEGGVVGENNQGYLEVRVERISEQRGKLVVEENLDRRRVYTLIGRQQNAPVELVGRRRARQIYESAAPGVWVQNPDGEWLRKPAEE